MYALVSSESAQVRVIPVAPSGKVKRRAEAIIIIVSNSECFKRTSEHSQEGELPLVVFGVPTVVDGAPRSRNNQ